MVNLVITNNKHDPLSWNRSSQHAKSCPVHPAGNFWGIFRCFLADAESTVDPSPIVACAFSPDCLQSNYPWSLQPASSQDIKDSKLRRLHPGF